MDKEYPPELDNPRLIYNKAQEFIKYQDYQSALSLLRTLMESEEFSALSYFHIAGIANIFGDAKYASECFYKAFEIDPSLNRKVLQKGHHLELHSYTEMDGRRNSKCPLCGGYGEPYWCYYIAVRVNCPKYFNPIRTWLYCKKCHHLFSAEPTEYREDDMSLLHINHTKANPSRFPLYSRILNSFRGSAQGNALLEVGVGTGECVAAAKEMGYDVTGIDITKQNVDYVNNTFGLNVIHGDFLNFPFKKLFDIIIMGDVIEHVNNPHDFIKKANELSHPGSVLWVSTPNFESTYTQLAGHSDPMRYEPSHCGYFSSKSLSNLLGAYGFDVINYEISAQYYGSMEITAVKR